jgi:hypothetical protein
MRQETLQMLEKRFGGSCGVISAALTSVDSTSREVLPTDPAGLGREGRAGNQRLTEQANAGSQKKRNFLGTRIPVRVSLESESSEREIEGRKQSHKAYR